MHAEYGSRQAPNSGKAEALCELRPGKNTLGMRNFRGIIEA